MSSRPKIRNILRRDTPENLWIKCPDTGQLVFYKDVESNQFVIPGSNYHMRMGAVARLKSIFDNETWFDVALPEVTADPPQIPRRAQICRSHQGCARQDRFERRHQGRLRQARGRRRRDRGAGFRFHGRFARHGCRGSNRARA